MASWKDVEEIALGLPEVAEEPAYGNRAWKVRKKLIVWERPLREKEIAELGGLEPEGTAPDGDILGVRVPDEEAKRALLESEPEIYFTTPHFDGSNSVLVRLDRIPRADLEEAIVEAWVSRAPKRVVANWSSSRNPPPGS
jgi:hypothetical protein